MSDFNEVTNKEYFSIQLSFSVIFLTNSEILHNEFVIDSSLVKDFKKVAHNFNHFLTKIAPMLVSKSIQWMLASTHNFSLCWWILF